MYRHCAYSETSRTTSTLVRDLSDDGVFLFSLSLFYPHLWCPSMKTPPTPSRDRNHLHMKTHIHTHATPFILYWGPYIPSGIDDSIDVLQRDTVTDCCSSLYLCLFYSSSIFIFHPLHQKKRRTWEMTEIWELLQVECGEDTPKHHTQILHVSEKSAYKFLIKMG